VVNAAPCEITNVMVARVLLKCFGWLLVGQHDMSHAIFNARLVPKAGPVISGNFHHVISHGVAFTIDNERSFVQLELLLLECSGWLLGYCFVVAS